VKSVHNYYLISFTQNCKNLRKNDYFRFIARKPIKILTKEGYHVQIFFLGGSGHIFLSAQKKLFKKKEKTLQSYTEILTPDKGVLPSKSEF